MKSKIGKLRIALILLTVFFLSLNLTPAQAAEHHVFSGGSIQTAINAASPYDTIIVHPGTYGQPILLNKDGLTLRSSDGPSVTTIDFTGVWCGYWYSGPGGIDIPYGTSGVTVEGFTVLGSSSASDALISVGGDNNVIRNNIVIGDPASSGQDIGIHVAGQTSAQLPAGNVISNNEAYNHAGAGIFIGNWAGIDNVVTGNIVHDNVVGFIPGWNGNGIEVDRVMGVVVTRNTVYNNEAAGVKVVRTAPNAIIEMGYNFITDNLIGILSENWLSGAISTATVTIICNNIENNNNYGVFNSVAATIDAENNWWDDVSGPSGQGSGIGDAVSTNVDYDPWLPAPFDSDLDNDGLTCCAEVTLYGTDPTNPDTDGGGMYDGHEILLGKDPLDPRDDIIPRKSAVVGGYYVPAKKLIIILPYLALVGLISAVASILTIKRRQKRFA